MQEKRPDNEYQVCSYRVLPPIHWTFIQRTGTHILYIILQYFRFIF